MRKLGFTVVPYLDDSWLMKSSKEECIRATYVLKDLLTSLGFLINEEKSVLEPVQEINFLGYLVNFIEMTIKPTQEKRDKVVNLINSLLDKSSFSIQEGASLIGVLNGLTKGIEYGSVYVKNLEMDTIQTLRQAGPLDWDSLMPWSDDSISDLFRWLNNVP